MGLVIINKQYSYLLGLTVFILLSLFLHRDELTLDIQGKHNWRQSQTMWNVSNFARHDANIFNPRVSNFDSEGNNIRRYEFPVMQWSIAMAMKVFGEHIIVMRLIMFSIGIFSILGIYFLIHYFTKDWGAALIGAILFQFSPLFYFYSVNPLPDNLGLSASIWYCYFIIRYLDNRTFLDLLIASFCILLATLAKLPYLMFSIVSIVYFISRIFKEKELKRDNLKFALFQLLWIAPALAWYAWVIPTWNANSVTKGIFSNDASWDVYVQIFDYHRHVMFPKIILFKYSWPFLILGLYHLWSLKPYRKWILSILGITFLYLILEFIPIGYIHDYYMIPFLISLYIIVGIGVSFLLRFSKLLLIPFLLMGVASAFHTQHNTKAQWSIENSGFNEALYTHTEEFRKAVPSHEKCIILNDISAHVFSYRIDKMGFIFNSDHLPADWIVDMITNYDIKYMYSDSKKVNSDPDVLALIDSTILSIGTVNVYKLKDTQSIEEVGINN